MGILKDVAAIVAGLTMPPGFAVCELGDQGMSGLAAPMLARDWYVARGCTRYESIDGNGRGTITADLNLPLERRLALFDLVTDFGTSEHVFDQAQVWRTLHSLVKPRGLIAFDRPAQGYHKHCFYLINECLIRDLAAANQYEVVHLSRATTPRGELLRGVLRTPSTSAAFRVPQQGKYTPDLVIR